MKKYENPSISRFLNESLNESRLNEYVDESTFESCREYMHELAGKIDHARAELYNLKVDNHFDNVILGTIFADDTVFTYNDGYRNRAVENILKQNSNTSPVATTLEEIDDMISAVSYYLYCATEYLQDHWDEF